jgi:hypothetical protein
MFTEKIIRPNSPVGLFFWVMWLVVSAPVYSQSTHVERLQLIGTSCLGSVPASLDSFLLDSDDASPYIRQALISEWKSDGRRVYATDSLHTLPELRYRVETAKIELYRAGKNQYGRAARLSVSYRLTSESGEILSDGQCADIRSDTLSAALASSMRDSRYPETDVEPPRGGWFRKFLQPAVVLGASAIGTYLFFNLRSRRTDNR